MNSLFTIGYEGATPAALADALDTAGVEVLVDVRAVANSRRPGFSKRALAAGVDERGIAYLHLRALGTPADGRAAARAGRHDEMRRIFSKQLETEAAQEDVAALVQMLKQGRKMCLLCFEREPEHCHRLMIAERVEAEAGGAKIEHLHALPASFARP
ncbi:DUF488 domain-containing protein [Chelatococcus sambhunathii]|uniref:DUF488 domain-containing protein n=1 Tax=Chelatococcus sambhunathii TaxID=363953 RepID=A0ABU1DLC3_9HYPH|nr:DUF488 domain-containing protein [Chelatococcus sambhunathii]MDR4308803.1 DUF488 domain-containing protein [Chelatococcus sambhunathii]